jgi:UDP-N-acetylglucosamine--N-acetylmuramyl-(pentapeptide) pyrophosphoryl-undecaprenol N-acetylglucosamine transferase
MSLRIILAGGGTGGHVFPLVAVANALAELKPDCRVLFVGTRRGMEASVVPALGRPIVFLDIRPIRGMGVYGALRGAARAMAVMPDSLALIDRERPHLVLSVGGYAAGPVTLAAWMRGIPTALLEPNSAMGLANVCVAQIVDRAYTAFAEVERAFSPQRVYRTGVPLRAGFAATPVITHEGPMRILVLGGSQGAAALNELVPKVIRDMAEPVEVVHQCGGKHADKVRDAYADHASGRVRIEAFIENMPAAIAWADLVISRSGASAVSEICAIGRPSILIPFPFAAGAHQLKNARALESIGAAICIESDKANHQSLTECIRRLQQNRESLQRMSRAACDWGRPDAARAIALDVIALASPQQHHRTTCGGASQKEYGGTDV